MRASVRLAALVGIIAVTSWLSFSAKAHALQSCTVVVNKFCSFPDYELGCIPGGIYVEGVCVCGSNHHYYCY